MKQPSDRSHNWLPQTQCHSPSEWGPFRNGAPKSPRLRSYHPSTLAFFPDILPTKRNKAAESKNQPQSPATSIFAVNFLSFLPVDIVSRALTVAAKTGPCTGFATSGGWGGWGRQGVGCETLRLSRVQRSPPPRLRNPALRLEPLDEPLVTQFLAPDGSRYVALGSVAFGERRESYFLPAIPSQVSGRVNGSAIVMKLRKSVAAVIVPRGHRVRHRLRLSRRVKDVVLTHTS